MPSRHSRATPLPPDDRRRSIVDAVLPLIDEMGGSVTTRQMAEAAGVAEGTIFKVFDDKAAIVHEALRASLDPEPVRRALAEIDPAASLRGQLTEAARIVLERSERAWTILTLLHSLPAERPVGTPPPYVAESNAAVVTTLTELFDRHRHQIRVEPKRAAILFRSLLYASRHPFVDLDDRLTVDEIVDALLTGISVPVDVG